MKVILATIHLEESTRAIPLAAACLKAASSRHDILLRDYTLDQSAAEIAEGLLYEPSTGCVGFPVYLWNRSLVLEIIKILKAARPELPLIAGGPEVTAAADSFLKESGIAAAMVGEGEVIIDPLLDALEAGETVPSIPGIVTANSGPSSPVFCLDINGLNSPILSGALDLSHNRGLLWELSRGCPFACEFCFESKGSGKVRTFALERIRAELEMIRDAGIQQVFVLDPTFNVNKKRVLTILEWIRELTPETYYYFEVRTEFLDEETALAFATVPCTLQIGLQSASTEVLKNINRRFDPDEFRSKTALLGEAGVSFGLDLIYGLPGDSLEGFRNSMDYALSLEPNHLDLFPLAVLPGTALYDRREELDMDADCDDPYIVRETPGFPAADMKKAGKLSTVCDRLYNQNRGISWLSRVCYDLDLSPVGLMDLAESPVDEEFSLPVFLESAYKKCGRESLFPVIEDMLGYLDLLEEIEQCESSYSPEGQIVLDDDLELHLHGSCRIGKFHLHPSVVTAGFPGASEDLMAEAGSFRTLFWLRDYELCVDLLSKEEEEILMLLKKGVSLGVLKNRFPDMEEFLLSGILESYIEIG